MLRGLAAGVVLIAGPAAAAPFEVAVAPNLSAFAAPVGCALFRAVEAWGGAHAYRFPPQGASCAGRTVVAVGWTEAAVWANALSERSGLKAAYVDAAGQVVRDANRIDLVPASDPRANGYRLPALAELGLPALRARMTRVQEWSDTRIDLGDGRPYFYLCRPGACDFHSPRTTGRGVAFRLVRVRRPGPMREAGVNHSPSSSHPSRAGDVVRGTTLRAGGPPARLAQAESPQ